MADYIDGICFALIATAPILTVVDFTQYFSRHKSNLLFYGSIVSVA
jgi:hypothetical protein